jgi:hypothetical protein
MRLDTKTYWVTDRQSQCDFDFAWSTYAVEGLRVKQSVEENSEGSWIVEVLIDIVDVISCVIVAVILWV